MRANILGSFRNYQKLWNYSFKDTQREKAPSNKTQSLTKNTNMDIWFVGTSNQLFIRCSETETKFSKK